jgi:O-antigen ligase
LISTNNSYISYLKGALFFCYFLLRGASLDELLGKDTGVIELSIGTYLLSGGLILFSIPALFQGNTRLPLNFFYLFGVIFLMTLSFLFWNNLGDGNASFRLYFEYVASLSLVFFIFLTFQTRHEIDLFFKALVYSCLIISIFWIVIAMRNPGSLWRVGNILGSGASYSTVSYQLAAAAWVGPMVNLLDSNRSFGSKVFQDIPFLIILTSGILLTGTKGGVLVLICLLIILVFFHLKGMTNQSLLRVTFEVVIFVIIPFAALGYFINNWGGELGVINRLIMGFLSLDTSNSRLEILLFAKDQIFSDIQSLLIGSGFGTFNLLSGSAVATYPHNFFLDLGFNAGLPAAFLFMVWLVQNWKHDFRYLRQKEQDPALRILMLKTVGWGVVACIFGVISAKFSSHTMLWFFLALSIRIRQNTFRENEKPQI